MRIAAEGCRGDNEYPEIPFDPHEAEAALQDWLAHPPPPLIIKETHAGLRLATQPEMSRWVKLLSSEPRPSRLTQPGLETLAIIAYRQPISRAEIEAVRGVAVGGVLETLIDRGLVRVAGRAEVPGRPLLYETTEAFLLHFGLRSIEELPNLDELKRAKLPEPADSQSPNQPELLHDATRTSNEN